MVLLMPFWLPVSVHCEVRRRLSPRGAVVRRISSGRVAARVVCLKRRDICIKIGTCGWDRLPRVFFHRNHLVMREGRRALWLLLHVEARRERRRPQEAVGGSAASIAGALAGNGNGGGAESSHIDLVYVVGWVGSWGDMVRCGIYPSQRRRHVVVAIHLQHAHIYSPGYLPERA